MIIRYHLNESIRNNGSEKERIRDANVHGPQKKHLPMQIGVLGLH